MYETRARSVRAKVPMTTASASMYPPMFYLPTAPSTPPSFVDLDEGAGLQSEEEVKGLEDEANARKQQAEYVTAGLKINMDKLAEINKVSSSYRLNGSYKY